MGKEDKSLTAYSRKDLDRMSNEQLVHAIRYHRRNLQNIGKYAHANSADATHHFVTMMQLFAENNERSKRVDQKLYFQDVAEDLRRSRV